MKKRSKIIALVTTLCLCLSMFVVGVLAAKSATFNVTSTLNFTADGVYVMVDASLKQGADVATAAVLTEGAPTQPRFKAYSYPRESGQDYPNGEPSTKHFVNESGTQVSTWAIGDINYTSTNKVVVYEFMVYNYSNFEVIGTVEGISEALASYADQLSITTYRGTSSADATATGSPTYSFTIPARTNETTPGVTCYKIAVTLNNFLNPLATDTIEMNVNFEKAPEPVYEYFTYSGNRITGLSDTYLNLETKPETLVIPNTDAEGNDITTIKNGSYSSPTFQGLKSSKVIIQEGITSIGAYAFYNCSGLTSVSLPSSLTSIGTYAFSGCSGLTGELKIPEGVTSIGQGAFSGCSGLTGKLVIPEKVTSIGGSAFSGCSGLTGELEIPEGVTSIGSSAFRGCSGLTGELKIPEGVTSIDQYVFYGCSGLTGKLVIPEKVTSIGGSAFSGCSGLTGELKIPEGVTSIEIQAFSGCRSLTSLSLPSKLTSIEIQAFSGCSGLTGELKIPEGVTSIESNAFSGCSGLTSVSLPNSVTSIGSSAFSGCSGLNSMNYLGTIEQWCKIEFMGSSSNPTYYTHALYIQGEEITNLVIPESVTSIGNYAFYNCSSLTGELEIPEGVTSIGSGAFYGCSGLTGELVIPEGVTSIYSSAFSYCSSLTSVSLPSLLTSIGSSAFSGCSGLTSVRLPSSLTSIGSDAFRNCFSLKYIQITGNLTSPYTLPSGTWVKTDSATEPTDWNTNVATSIPTTNSAGYYHQKSAWESAN